MKSESEVRMFRDHLRMNLRKGYCPCPHCAESVLRVRTQIAALSWVLGEEADGDRAAENAAALAARVQG